MSFATFKLSKPIQEAIKKQGFTKPTAVQTEVIPFVLQGHDLMVQAQTGSGKSASFVLPLLELWSHDIPKGKPKVNTLILTPTRELSLQVAETFNQLSERLDKKPKIVSLIGGEGIGNQLYDIQQGCDIIVATSGRLLDVLSKKQLYLNHIKHFILDEADKMLNLGFTQELEQILELLPKKRQNLLFSATYPTKIIEIIKKITTTAQHITIEGQATTVENIKQRVIEVNPENRGPLLRHLLKSHPWQSVMVFMANKRATDNIADKFRKKGFKADSLHGDLSQEDRNYTLKAFRDKKFRILFTTDIASRGLDIDDISCVINFDLPRSPADYIHRIGRTGRAGKSGLAISFIGHEEANHFKLIEKRAHIKLDREQISGFELLGDAPKKSKGPAPVKGKKKSKKDKLREQALKNGK